MMPMFRPRRLSVDSMATIDWAIGTIGPSITPSRIRAPKRRANPVARPDRAEQIENRNSMISRICLRRRVASATEASRKPEQAMATESPEASRPSWVLLMWNSSTM